MKCVVCGSGELPPRKKQGCQAKYCSQACRRTAEKRRANERSKTPRARFRNQRGNARRRGIEFVFTFAEWLTWWGADIERMGRGKGKLVMGRYGDCGPYAPHNCYKAEHSENWHGGPRSSFWRLRTHCCNGHLLEGENVRMLDGARVCATCRRERGARWTEKQRQLGRIKPRLAVEEVRRIRERVKFGASVRDTAKLFCSDIRTIQLVVRYATWRNISDY